MKQILTCFCSLFACLLLPTTTSEKSVHATSTKLVQRVYLQSCTGSWYLDKQGAEENSDWVDLACTDTSDELNDPQPDPEESSAH